MRGVFKQVYSLGYDLTADPIGTAAAHTVNSKRATVTVLAAHASLPLFAVGTSDGAFCHCPLRCSCVLRGVRDRLTDAMHPCCRRRDPRRRDDRCTWRRYSGVVVRVCVTSRRHGSGTANVNPEPATRCVSVPVACGVPPVVWPHGIDTRTLTCYRGDRLVRHVSGDCDGFPPDTPASGSLHLRRQRGCVACWCGPT